ncbi:hypothetical protein Nepgr_026202 [Nepenthes gracilis]|uniref:Stigma-specific STIG1-like protein 1 n=1 Tax=Nepenthes gracilis TaxID=150966 RepID=A0AAD3Y1V1_NEPGR|nr:hypothetical protein Nepgr_026202 [Nepenthes gracilis]
MAEALLLTKVRFAYLLHALPLLLLAVPVVEGNPSPRIRLVHEKPFPSPWLRRQLSESRSSGCDGDPSACGPVGRCCNNVCVDLTSSPENCGGCGRLCPSGWECCGGACAYVTSNTDHCGQCDKKCMVGTDCHFGMCGYAQDVPHSTFLTNPSKTT